MHHLSVKKHFVDATSKTKDVGSRGNDAPLCPKPRRLGSALPAQFLNHPAVCTKHHMNSDGRSGIVNIVDEKRMDEGNELCGCSRYSCGSPPGRTHNPLIHDVNFLEIHARVDTWPQLTPTNT